MTYTPRLPPRAHQVAGRAKLHARPLTLGDVFAWVQEMGTGKTYNLLWEWGELVEAGELFDLLAIAPAGSYRNWWYGAACELNKHLAPELRERTLVQGWVSGMGVNAMRALGAFLEVQKRPRVLAVNVEALQAPGKARDAVTAFLAAGRAMMVVDESSRIRTWNSKRTDWIIRAGWAARARRIMSGLPAPRSPLDLYSQFEFLDSRIIGTGSYFAFSQRYAKMIQIRTGRLRKLKSGEVKPELAWVVDTDKAGNPIYKNQEELAALIAPYSFRVLKKDCLDLPPKLYLPERRVELTDEQRRVYRDLTEQATAELDGGGYVSPDRRITQIMRLRQVCGGFVTDDTGSVRALKSHRITALMEVLEEQLGKVIVWCTFDPELRAVAGELEREYGEAAVARFWGGNAATRHEDEARWKDDPQCRFLVSTPASGGVGNNWTMGNLSVYFSNSYDLEHRAQSEDRTHRDGLAGTATYLDLVCPGTVEDRILDCLRRKIDMSALLMGDGYRQWLR